MTARKERSKPARLTWAKAVRPHLCCRCPSASLDRELLGIFRLACLLCGSLQAFAAPYTLATIALPSSRRSINFHDMWTYSTLQIGEQQETRLWLPHAWSGRLTFSANLPYLLPCGKTSTGLPIGLQLIIGPFTDPKLLQIARIFLGNRP
jgi:hypothetical protein